MPAEKYRELQAEKARRAAVLLEGTTTEYLEKGRDLEARLDQKPEDDLYFKKGIHRYDRQGG